MTDQAPTFSTLKGYEEHEDQIQQGTVVEVEYDSVRSSTPVTHKATVDRVTREAPPYMMWIDIPDRRSRFSVSLFHGSSNIHYVQPGAPRPAVTANLPQTDVKVTIIDQPAEDAQEDADE